MIYADLGPLGEDTDHVEAHGLEVWLCGVEAGVRLRSAGYFACGGDGFQWVSEAGPAPQLDFHKDERLVQIYKHWRHPSWCFEFCSQRTAPSV